jgi:anti-sigma-K factor RskA
MNLTHEQVLDLAAAFVLGALDPEEEQAVRDHLASCDLSHDELAELGGVVPYLAESVDLVEPPVGLKDRIMAAAAADLEARRTGAAPTPERPPAEPQADRQVAPFPTAEEREVRRRRTNVIGWALRIAAVLVIAALGAWNLRLQQDLNATRTDLNLALQPTNAVAVLRPEGAGPSGIGLVLADGSVRIQMRNLAPTTGSQIYEAWVIAPGGAPVPIGGFPVGQDGIGSLVAPQANATPGVTLALTREPGPGATAPTLPIVSAGVATAP